MKLEFAPLRPHLGGKPSNKEVAREQERAKSGREEAMEGRDTCLEELRARG